MAFMVKNIFNRLCSYTNSTKFNYIVYTINFGENVEIEMISFVVLFENCDALEQ